MHPKKISSSIPWLASSREYRCFEFHCFTCSFSLLILPVGQPILTDGEGGVCSLTLRFIVQRHSEVPLRRRKGISHVSNTQTFTCNYLCRSQITFFLLVKWLPRLRNKESQYHRCPPSYPFLHRNTPRIKITTHFFLLNK